MKDIIQHQQKRRLLPLGVALLVLLMAVSGRARDGRIELSGEDFLGLPCVISNAGSYVLTDHLVVSNYNLNGILIAADDVTIDLNGFTIRGSGEGVGSRSVGILQSNEWKNATIMNGTIAEWDGGYSHGILVSGVNSRVIGVTFRTNRRGLTTGAGALVADCIFVGRRYGVMVGEGSIVRDCLSFNHEDSFGIIASEDCIVEGCAVTHNYGAITGKVGTIIRETTAVSNSSYCGISINTGAVIDACAAYGNRANGIEAYRYATITRCASTRNSENGIHTRTDCLIESCIGTSNDSNGVAAAHGGNIRRSAFYGNDRCGIDVSNNCAVALNSCSFHLNSGNYGIRVRGQGNTIRDNHLPDNYAGIRVDQGGNAIMKNSTYGCNNASDISTGNVTGRFHNSFIILQEPWANFGF